MERVVEVSHIYARIQEGVDAGRTTISLQGGARSGKTYSVLIWLITRCLQHPGTRVSVVRATLPSLRRSVFVDFVDILRAMDLYRDAHLNKSELTYGLPNGSRFEFFSTDSEQKLRGAKRDILFVNEANDLTPLEWQQLKMRTTRLSILDYNPSFGDDHWITRENEDPRTHHFITTYRDNPFLEPNVIEEIESLRGKNASLWQIYGEGLQAQVEGLIFPTVARIPDIPPQARRRWVGVDFGFTHDPTAIVEVALHGPNLYIDEIAYRTEMLTGEIIRILKAHASGLRVISESADPRLVKEIHRAGIDIHPVRKYPGSVSAGLAKMQEMHLHVTERSVNILREFARYTWAQDKDGAYLNRPIDEWDHAMDAVRYVVLSELLGGERGRVDTRRLEGLIY